MDSKRKSTFEYTEPAHDSLPKKILLWLLQVFGAVTAVLFGTFSILEWQNSENAATQADVANLVAFLSFCGDLRSNNGSGMIIAPGVCAAHAPIAEIKLRSYALAELPLSSSVESSSRGSSGPLNPGAIAGITTAAAVMVVAITGLTAWSFVRQRAAQKETLSWSEKTPSGGRPNELGQGTRSDH